MKALSFPKKLVFDRKTMEIIAGAAVILLIVCISYNHLIGLSFAKPDDRWMLLKNQLVHPEYFSLHYLFKTFTSFNDIQYSPVNTVYYYLIYQINGYDPYYYHIFSFLIHLLNALLIYLIAKDILEAFAIDNSTQVAWFTSLIWAIHPLNVEPVVWISASKIVLSSFFSLLSFLFFLKAFFSQKTKFFMISIFSFLISCFCKEQSIVTPMMYILFIACFRYTHDKQQFGSRKLYIYVAALLLISVIFGIITVIANGMNAVETSPITAYPLYQRIILSFYCLSFYIADQVVPLNLHYFYSFPIKPYEGMPLSFYLFPAAFLIFSAVIILLLRYVRSIYFYIFGIGIFCIQIGLVLQIIPMTRPAILADRYMYLPLFASTLLLVNLGINELYVKLTKTKYKTLVQLCFTGYVLYLTIYSNCLVSNWDHLNLIQK